MVKFPEAEARIFRDKFVCRKCKSVLKVQSLRVAEGSAKCRKCKAKVFKPKRKK